jgi:archaellum component FlaF (FlaF/FlaG flagellin family)
MSGFAKGLAVIPEWMALQLAQLEDLALSKTKEWSPAADGVRPLRPEDVGLSEGTMGFAVTPGAYTIISSYSIASGLGILFCGWFLDGDIGYNSYLQVKINGVKRQEVAGRVPYQQASRIVLCLEQIAYARENDKVTLTVYNSGTTTVSCTVWPIAYIAGPRKTLLIE